MKHAKVTDLSTRQIDLQRLSLLVAHVLAAVAIAPGGAYAQGIEPVPVDLTAIVDPGSPTPGYLDPEAGQPRLRIRTGGFVLNGFRWRGSHLSLSGLYGPYFNPTGEVQLSNGNYPGYYLPSGAATSVEVNQFWVGVFACDRGQGIEVVFQPYLRVTSVDGASGLIYSTHSGAPVSVNALAGRDVLVCGEGGFLSGRKTAVIGNGAAGSDSTGRIEVAERGSVQAGDYLLTAPSLATPQGNCTYKYICTLKVDRTAQGLNWRNFAMVKPTTHSRTYTYFDWPNNTVPRSFPSNQAPAKVDFREHLPPLATGVSLNALVRRSEFFPLSVASEDVTLELSHDSSGHSIAMFGMLNAVSGGGIRTNAMLAFSKQQALWVTVSGPTNIFDAQIVIQGWLEE